jgi:acyl-coenzyme A synthetase/AMP-(fatty) acid ligase
MTYLDRLPDFGLLALHHCLIDDYWVTGDTWYRDEAGRVWAKIEERQR